MANRLFRWLGIFALAITSASAVDGETPVPNADGYVVDRVGLLTFARKQQIAKLARDFETRKGTRVSVLIADADPGTVEPGDGVVLVVEPREKRARLVYGSALNDKLKPRDVKRINELAVKPPTKQWDAGHWVEEALRNVIVVLELGPGAFSTTFIAKPVGITSVQRARIASWGIELPIGVAVLVFIAAIGMSRQSRVPPSVLGIVVANSVPIVGVLAFDWDVLVIFLVFWLENVVIIVMDAARVLLARPEGLADLAVKLYNVPVALVFPLLFTLGQLTAILGIFAQGSLERIAKAPNPIEGLVDYFDMYGLGVPFAVIAAVHLAMFLGNYILGGEYRLPGAGNPERSFARIAMLHVTLIFGGIAASALGSPVWAIVVLVLVKTVAELALSFGLARKNRAAA